MKRRTFVSGTAALAAASVVSPAFAATVKPYSWDLSPPTDTRDNFIAWGTPGGAAGIAATKPFDGNAASVGNGVMVAFEAKDQAQVDRLYAIALAHGGTDEGPPGPRGDSGFYAGYFRDPDGNKLNAFVMG